MSREVRRIRELNARLDTFDPAAHSGLDAILPDLSALLEAPAMSSYSVGIQAAQLSVDWIHTHGISEPHVEHLRTLLERTQFNSCAYSPVRPDPRQRNRALTLADLKRITGRAGTPAPFTELFDRMGLPDGDQLRVLVCGGPALLAWVGAYRPSPFGAREKRILAALTPGLQRHLSWELYARPQCLRSAAFDAALEEIAAPAFIVNQAARVVFANRAGKTLLDANSAETSTRIADSVRLHPEGPGRVRELRQTGLAPHFLVLLPDASKDVHARARALGERCQLTPRQTDVLALLAEGYANKMIAGVLECATGTVELHVSAILRKIGVESRSELVARFWSGGD